MAVFPIDYLRDDFEDNTIGAAWVGPGSGVSGSATRSETGGQAVFTLPSSAGVGPHVAQYVSGAQYDLTGDQASISIGTMVATGVAATAYFQLILDGSNWYQWVQTSGTLKAQKIVGGVAADLFSAAWSATNHKFLRIRESGGTVFFDSSTNGTSWTNRGSTTIASAFAVTALTVAFGAQCGNVASPGSFKLDMFNLLLPTPTSTWRWTDANWPEVNRHRSYTLASSGNAQGVIVTADSRDASDVLGGTVRYFAGPVGSSSGGFAQLTEYSTLAAAQANPFTVPNDGRVDLPAVVQCLYHRFYHRSTDGSAHIIREYVPRRLVQADDIEAESIRALHITVLDLDAQHYITAGGGVVTLDENGVSITAPNAISYNAQYGYTFHQTDDTIFGGTWGWDSPTQHGVNLQALSLTGEDSFLQIEADAPSGNLSNVQVIANAGTGSAQVTTNVASSGNPLVTISASKGASTAEIDVQINGATPSITATMLNVGTATGATAGQIITSADVTAGTTLIADTTDAVTNSVSNTLIQRHHSSGTPAANFGMANYWQLETSTHALVTAMQVNVTWATATNGSQKARAQFIIDDTAGREFMRAEASGAAAMLGFFGAAAVAKPTVTGAKGGNAALTSLMTALANLGLVTDSTT